MTLRQSNYLVPSSIVIAGVLIAAGLYFASSGSLKATTTTVTIPGKTTTSVSTITSFSTSTLTSTLTGRQPTGPSPVTLTASFDVWKLSANLDRTVITEGRQLNFTFYLENTWTANESIAVSNPLANPAIYTQQGKLAWSYEQSATTAIQQIAPGQKLYDQLLIPTSELQSGQTYIFTSYPNIGEATSPATTPIGQYLQVYAEITVLAHLYNVTFQQMGACSPPVYVAPWSVTMNGTTKVEPPNGSVSTNGGYSAGPEPPSVYSIVFSVPDGVYHYVLAPQGAFYTFSGTVTVNGSNLSVILEGPAVSCTTTTGGY